MTSKPRERQDGAVPLPTPSVDEKQEGRERGSEAMALNLDNYFRSDSAARRVAERLLTGVPATRSELAAGVVSLTTVNRVVDVLERQGCKVLRDKDGDGRRTVFQFVHIDKSEGPQRYPELFQRVKIIAGWLMGDSILLDFTAEEMKFRGIIRHSESSLPLGKSGVVTSVRRAESEPQNAIVALEFDDREIQVDNVQSITTAD